MKNIDLIEAKKIETQILIFIDTFCKENGIKYWLGYGTMLGAVRHKGFIPWDDDIDIIMLRDDYERFIKMFNDDKGIYKLHCLENNTEYKNPFAKVEDSRTICKEGVNSFDIGLYIDVFPIDNMGNTLEDSKNIVRKMLFYQKIFNIKLLKHTKKNDFFSNFCLYMAKIILSPISMRYTAEIVSKKCRNAGIENSKYIGCMVWGYGYNEILERGIIDNTEKYEFEKGYFPGFKDYDYYLSVHYGSYMKLPPMNERRPHPRVATYWK